MTIEQTTQEELFYLVDSRSTVGTNAQFWADGGGYATSLEKAEKFPKSEAVRQYRSRDTDIPVPASFLDGKKRQRVDMQVLPVKAALDTPPSELCVIIERGRYDGNDSYFVTKASKSSPEFNKALQLPYAAAIELAKENNSLVVYRLSDIKPLARSTASARNLTKKNLLLAGFDYLITPKTAQN
jgi:hypothetical protein